MGKYRRIAYILSFISVFLFANCASSQTGSSLDELDAAVREASNYLNNNIPKGNKLVILNFQSEHQALSEYIIDELISNTVNDRVFTVVDRANLALVLAEHNFQLSGEVSDESAVSIGQMLGAQTIVSGAISQIGDLFRLRVRALDVKTAEIQGQFNRNIPNGPTVMLLTGSPTAASRNTTASSNAAAPRQAQSAAAYKIGDTGPAGGIVFYDKGNSLGGWRFLEAAPASTEVTASHYYLVSGTSRKVGDGYENTRKFIEEFNQKGGGINTAPWLCNELNIKGYSDWYLPSLDELLYMYNNLYLNGIGELNSTNYWSSYSGSGLSGIYYLKFSDGSENWASVWGVDNKYQVRAIRRF
jgi:TolB-like protein